MIALNSIPLTLAVFDEGANETGVFAVPTRTRQSALVVAISFDADPGNSSFGILGSLDGTNFILIGSELSGTDDTPLGVSIPDWPWTFVDVYSNGADNPCNITVKASLG